MKTGSNCSIFSNIILLSFKRKPFNTVFQSKIETLKVNPLNRKNIIELPNYILILGKKKKKERNKLKSENDPIQRPGPIY